MPKNKAQVLVAEDQLSLAIGKEGQNASLAAAWTGWKIDIKSGEKFEKEQKTTKKTAAKEVAAKKTGAKKVNRKSK